MTLRVLATAAAVTLAAGAMFSGGAARADGQVTIERLNPGFVPVDECSDGCQVDLLYRIRNNGLVNSVISLRTITESIIGVPGTDLLNDVVTPGPTGQAFPGSCGTALEAFQTCLIDAKVTIIDTDVPDANHDDAHADFGDWNVRLVVPWDVPQPPCDPARTPVPDVCSDTTTSGAYTVRVLDDATTGVPEPAAWALLIAGFGLAGAALRRRAADLLPG